MNVWQGRGGITRPPKYMESKGFPIWSATVACNGTAYDPVERKQVVRTTYLSLVAFGAKAIEVDNLNLNQGDEILVFGELGNREIETKSGPERKTRIEVLTVDVIRRSGAVSNLPPVEDAWADSAPGENAFL